MTSKRTCDACGGTGEIPWDHESYYSDNPPDDPRCRVCDGRGWQSDAHECQCVEHDCQTLLSCDGICSVSGALHLCPLCFSRGHSPIKFAVLGFAAPGLKGASK